MLPGSGRASNGRQDLRSSTRNDVCPTCPCCAFARARVPSHDTHEAVSWRAPAMRRRNGRAVRFCQWRPRVNGAGGALRWARTHQRAPCPAIGARPTMWCAPRMRSPSPRMRSPASMEASAFVGAPAHWWTLHADDTPGPAGGRPLRHGAARPGHRHGQR